MHKKLWNKDYILLLQASAISTLGDLMYSVAIGYWVYTQTGSSALMGIMSSISMFITMFLSPFCGSIVDKCNRKWIMAGLDAFQGLLMLGVGILAYMNALNIPIVLIAAVLAAFGSVFYHPAASTLLLDIVPREDLIRGQSIHSGANSLINLMGSAFSGAMVAAFGAPLIIVANGISNLYSAFSELLIRVPKTIQQGTPVTPKGILKDMGAALQTIFADNCLRLFVPCAMILNLLGAGPMTLMLPFCMEKNFTVDMYGYLIAVYTAASLICVLLLGIFKLKPKTRFWIMAIGFTCSVIFFTGAAFCTKFLPMCILAFLSGFANSAGNSVFNASLMLALPEENRSTILGFIQTGSVGGCALSAVIYGFLGEFFPLYLTFAIGNSISLIPMLYLCFHRETKRFILNHCN